MQTYSKEEIDARRIFFKEQGFKEIDAEIGDLKFSYFVIPKELNSGLSNFVFRMTGKDRQDGAIYGVSNSIKEDFRRYAVAHEVIEFSEIGINQIGRCAKALEREISLVPKEIRADYVKMRTQFFKDLISYTSSSQHYTDEDLREFKTSLKRLAQLERELEEFRGLKEDEFFAQLQTFNKKYNNKFKDIILENRKASKDYRVLLDYLCCRDMELKGCDFDSMSLHDYLKKQRWNNFFYDQISEQLENRVKDRLDKEKIN